MTKQQSINKIVHWLEKWQQAYRRLHDAFEPLYKAKLIDATGEFHESCWGLFDQYTDMVAEKVGDTNGWLGWYQGENRMGDNELLVTIANGRSKRKRKFKIRTVDDLAEAIYEDIRTKTDDNSAVSQTRETEF